MWCMSPSQTWWLAHRALQKRGNPLHQFNMSPQMIPISQTQNGRFGNITAAAIFPLDKPGQASLQGDVWGVMWVVLKHLRESKHWNVLITQQYLDQGGSWNWCWLETTKMRLQWEPKKCTCSTQKKERGKRNHSTCRRQVIKDVCELESTVSHVKSRSNNWPWGRPLPGSRVPFDHLRSNFSSQRCQWCTAMNSKVQNTNLKTGGLVHRRSDRSKYRAIERGTGVLHPHDFRASWGSLVPYRFHLLLVALFLTRVRRPGRHVSRRWRIDWAFRRWRCRGLFLLQSV